MAEQIRIEILGQDVTDRFTPLVLPEKIATLELSNYTANFYDDGEMDINPNSSCDTRGVVLTVEDIDLLFDFIKTNRRNG